MEFMKIMFKKVFVAEQIIDDLFELIEPKKLEDYIIGMFNDHFMYGGLFDIFMEETNDLATTKVLLAYLGHDFVNLNDLTEEERAKYY